MTKQETAASVEPGKEIVNIEEQLKKELAELSGRVGAPPSNKISTSGKKFTLPNGDSDTTLRCVILDWRFVLAHYPGVYNAKSPQDPDCFAVGSQKPESGLLLPHKTIKKPHGEDCNTCPMNEWGSSPVGKGKACKNQVRLLVVGAEFGDDPTPLTLYVSPTGLKNWFAYATELARADNLNVIQVVTEIGFDPNETYPKLVFSKVEQHAQVQAAFGLRQRYQEMVERPIELRGARS